ncbi:MAG: hypothetical protein HYS13_15220 [Planctomycetia bacterium]|nr:hypothetical protein [Planctomycetia bacterium]
MARRRKNTPDYFLCPHCGAKVKVGSLSCRECGSDAETGWSEGADADLPTGYGDNDEFDYDEFLENEFPDQAPVSPAQSAKKWLWAALVIAVCIATLLYLVC